MAKKSSKSKPVPPVKKPKAFSPAVKTFITALVGNPNVTRAYRLAYPKSSAATASTNGCRLLRNARVREAVEKARAEKLKALEMDGAEALRRIALIGRVDVRQLYTEDGHLRSIHEWPEELAMAVKAIEPGMYGTRVKFDSRLGALELIARAEGKLTNKLDIGVDDDLATLLARHARPEEREA